LPRSPPRIAAAVLALPLACALFGNLKRDARLREALDAHAFARPLDEVWPEALRLLNERQYELVGKDREVVGAREQSYLGRMFAKGFETRDLGGGKRELETNPDGKMRRYRVLGTDAGNGTSHVLFYLLQGSTDSPSETDSRDLAMELALVQRLEPEAAQHIASAAGAR
jgi:hypothetical protein